jgi:DNA end-binding protein Ku
LVERRSEEYDPADLEDRYETRLRAMLDAKIKGEGLRAEAESAVSETNVIDLMAALRKSLGAPPAPVTEIAAAQANARPKRAAKGAAAENARKQPALKLPLRGGKSREVETAVPAASEAPARGRRKAS